MTAFTHDSFFLSFAYFFFLSFLTNYSWIENSASLVLHHVNYSLFLWMMNCWLISLRLMNAEKPKKSVGFGTVRTTLPPAQFLQTMISTSLEHKKVAQGVFQKREVSKKIKWNVKNQSESVVSRVYCSPYYSLRPERRVSHLFAPMQRVTSRFPLEETADRWRLINDKGIVIIEAKSQTQRIVRHRLKRIGNSIFPSIVLNASRSCSPTQSECTCLH